MKTKYILPILIATDMDSDPVAILLAGLRST